MHYLLPAVLLLATPVAAQTAPEQPRPIAASKIILVGDSTTAVVGGWGPSFCAYHVTSFAACVNLARGGRSSGSYRAEGSWALALAEMRAPGYRNVWVLIQFGHNDQPGKPGRSTDLATEFPANLARYVDEARAAGARPVLVTPLTRRTFKDGKLQNDLEPWAAAVRKVAAEKKVPLLDLNAESSAAVQAMGEAAADRFAQLPPGSVPIGPAAGATATTEVEVQPMAQPHLSFDRTHLGVEGANYFAAMVTRELAAAVPEMRPLLVR
jgi:lysophospholipase L1-like esterase